MSPRLVLSLALLGAAAFAALRAVLRERPISVPGTIARAEGNAAQGRPGPSVDLVTSGSLSAVARTPREAPRAPSEDPRLAILDGSWPCTLRCVLHPIEGGDAGDGGEDFAIITISSQAASVGFQTSDPLSTISLNGTVILRAPRTGVFTIMGLPPVDLYVTASLRTDRGTASAKTQPAFLSLLPGEQEYEVQLTPRTFRLQGSLRGLDLEDIAAAKASYTLHYKPPLWNAAQHFGPAFKDTPLLLDRLGAFEIPVVGPCQVNISVEGRPGRWLPASKVTHLKYDAPLQMVTVDVAGPSSLMLDPKLGEVTPGAQSARLEIWQSGTSTTYRFANAGPYLAPDLKPGPLEYRLEIQGEPSSIAWGAVTMAQGQRSNPELLLRPVSYRAVSGRLVYPDGKPLMFCTVNLHLGSLTSAFDVCKTGRRGEFKLEAPSAGSLCVTVSGVSLAEEPVTFTVEVPVGGKSVASPPIDLGELVARRSESR